MMRALPLVGAAASALLCAWWAALAVQSGDPTAVVLRFGLGTAATAYYVMLYRALGVVYRHRRGGLRSPKGGKVQVPLVP